jgi:hypothetical protein
MVILRKRVQGYVQNRRGGSGFEPTRTEGSNQTRGDCNYRQLQGPEKACFTQPYKHFHLGIELRYQLLNTLTCRGTLPSTINTLTLNSYVTQHYKHINIK